MMILEDAEDLAGAACAPSPAHDRLVIDLVRRHLDTRTVGFEMHLGLPASSGRALLRRLGGARDGAVVLAEQAGGVRISTLLRPAIHPAGVPVFAFIASLALSDALWGEGVAAAVQWPNDVVAGGRRIATCRATFAATGDTVECVVLEADVALGVHPAAAGVDPNALVAAYLNALERWWQAYDGAGADAVLRAWRRRDALAGRWVLVTADGGAPWRARALGVNGRGHLVVEDEHGASREVQVGEVRAASQPPAAAV